MKLADKKKMFAMELVASCAVHLLARALVIWLAAVSLVRPVAEMAAVER